LRLVHFVENDPKALTRGRAALLSHYERFEHAYAEHSQKEAALFGKLSKALNAGQRAELSEILRGL